MNKKNKQHKFRSTSTSTKLHSPAALTYGRRGAAWIKLPYTARSNIPREQIGFPSTWAHARSRTEEEPDFQTSSVGRDFLSRAGAAWFECIFSYWIGFWTDREPTGRESSTLRKRKVPVQAIRSICSHLRESIKECIDCEVVLLGKKKVFVGKPRMLGWFSSGWKLGSIFLKFVWIFWNLCRIEEPGGISGVSIWFMSNAVTAKLIAHQKCA